MIDKYSKLEYCGEENVVQYKVDLTEVEHLFHKKLPKMIVSKVYNWALRVEMSGLLVTRQIPGFHDEPLKGERLGQRSVRLTKSYRLFYEEHFGQVIIIKVIEVNKHDY